MWCGANVVITSGVTVGERCVIGANSVVTEDLEPFTIAAGVPARALRRSSARAVTPVRPGAQQKMATWNGRLAGWPCAFVVCKEPDGTLVRCREADPDLAARRAGDRSGVGDRGHERAVHDRLVEDDLVVAVLTGLERGEHPAPGQGHPWSETAAKWVLPTVTPDTGTGPRSDSFTTRPPTEFVFRSLPVSDLFLHLASVDRTLCKSV